MNKDQIKIKRIEKGTTTFFTIKGENVYDSFVKNIWSFYKLAKPLVR